MAPAELRAWLALLATPGLGRRAIRQLLERHGSAEAALEASPAAQQQAALGAAGIDRTLAWLAGGRPGDRRIVTLGDPEYPPRLLETPDPPLLLYTAGRIELLGAASIAVVGSRNPTPQGRDNALAFAAELGRAGLTIVSGLALGIDAAAHEGGLATPASTIGVIGTGIDIIYPKRHAALYERLAADGLIVSELPLGAPPLAAHFPQRNRIIAGLSLGTLVVEAALQSGSLITARLATEAGREVFAVPGSIHSPLARGCHALIQQGAKLVLDAKDVLDELQMPSPSPRPATPAGAEPPAAEDPLLEALGFDPQTLDALIARTGIPAATLNARLLDLELEGRVVRLPGQQFQRIGRA
jgi:DNA processing protein